jgi:hypothetical protein
MEVTGCYNILKLEELIFQDQMMIHLPLISILTINPFLTKASFSLELNKIIIRSIREYIQLFQFYNRP